MVPFLSRPRRVFCSTKQSRSLRPSNIHHYFVFHDFSSTEIIFRYIDFADGNLKDEDIQKLVEASEKATFGRNSEDVLDESYRKAWKMDCSQFAFQFDLAKSGILGIVHDQLLRYEKSTENLQAHLYKLNVYGTLL